MQVIVYGMHIMQFSINTVFDRVGTADCRRETGDRRQETGDGRRETGESFGFRFSASGLPSPYVPDP